MAEWSRPSNEPPSEVEVERMAREAFAWQASFGSWRNPFASSTTNACSSSRTDEAGKAAREHGTPFPAKANPVP